MVSLRRLVPLAVVLVLNQGLAPQVAGAGEPPRLTVVLVVDQLTADRTREWAGRSSSAGFRRLWEGGVVYDKAAYDHATTSTAPGHATIATGVPPSRHGIISNFWFERGIGRPIPSVFDREFGVSPLRLAAPTLTDRLHSSLGERAKIYSVSIKDRGAVFIAGKHGKAFWFSRRDGGFVSNAFYYPDGDVPPWLSAYNESAYVDLPPAWDLLMPEDAYQYDDDRAYEMPPRGWTNVFPHTYADQDSPQYYDQIRYAPHGDQITVGLARTIIENESLGMDADPDLLSISLSVTDRVGHAFGPNSREAEDNLHHLDLLIDEFLAYLQEKVGSERFLLVLSSDHGMSPIPEYTPGADLSATRILSQSLTEGLNLEYRLRLGLEQDLVTGIVMPWLYFDLSAIERLKLDMEPLYDIAGEWLEARPEIAGAMAVARLDDCRGEELCDLIRNVAFEGRSGEMYVVGSENSFVSFNPPVYAASHGSPYLRDRRVPVLFYGAGLKPRVVKRPVSPRHIAPTLAAALGLPPSGDWEPPLVEVAGTAAQSQ